MLDDGVQEGMVQNDIPSGSTDSVGSDHFLYGETMTGSAGLDFPPTASGIRGLAPQSRLDTYIETALAYAGKPLGERRNSRFTEDPSYPEFPFGTDTDEMGYFPQEHKRFAELMDICAEYMKKKNGEADNESIMLVYAAYNMAMYAHASHYRDTGEPYSVHFDAIARSLAENYQMDARTIAIALLHDAREDTDLPLEEIGSRLGGSIAKGVKLLTKVDSEKMGSKFAADEATRKNILRSLLQEPRVAVIKLEDRLNYFKTLEGKRNMLSRDPERISNSIKNHILETMLIYAPLARRLGLFDVSQELENWCLVYYKEGFADYAKRLQEYINEFFSPTHVDPVLVRDQVGRVLRNGSEVLIYHRLPQPFDIFSEDREIPSDENMFINLGIILPNTEEDWAVSAWHFFGKILNSGEYEIMDEDMRSISTYFFKLVKDGQIDSMRFQMVRKSDGLKISIHIYPEEAYLLEQAKVPRAFSPYEAYTPLVDFQGDDPILERMLDLDKRAQERSIVEKKLSLIKSRLKKFMSHVGNGEKSASDIVRLLEPRDPRGLQRVYLVKIDDGDERHEKLDLFPAGVCAIDVVRRAYPEEWQRVIHIKANGTKVSPDYVVRAGDRIEPDFITLRGGKEPDPKWLHELSDPVTVDVVRRRILGIIKREKYNAKRDFILRKRKNLNQNSSVAEKKRLRPSSEEKAAWELALQRREAIPGGRMYADVLTTGKWVIEKIAGRPLRVGLDPAMERIHQWNPQINSSEFYYLVGIADPSVPAGLITNVAEIMKEENVHVEEINLTFGINGPGQLMEVFRVARSVGVEIIGNSSSILANDSLSFVSLTVSRDSVSRIPELMEALAASPELQELTYIPS